MTMMEPLSVKVSPSVEPSLTFSSQIVSTDSSCHCHAYMQDGPCLLTALMEKLDWLEVRLFLKEELKFVSTMPGVVSVTTTGALPVPALSVASWDFSELVSAMYYHTQ